MILDKNSRNERSYEQHVYHRIQVFVTDLPFLETIGAEEASVTEGQAERTRHFEIAGCIDIVLQEVDDVTDPLKCVCPSG